MKLITITPSVSYPRLTFSRTIEMSKYIDVTWLCGWLNFEVYSFNDYDSKQHRVKVLGSGKRVGKFAGVVQELNFLLKAVDYLKRNDSDLILVSSHRLAFLYPMLYPKGKYVMQMYTTAVNDKRHKRCLWDTWGRFVRLPYKNFLVDTAQLQHLFKIHKKNCFITGHGSLPISNVGKVFDTLRLLYIGALGPSRRVEDTFEGLLLFIKKYPKILVSYDVIGKGTDEYVKMFKSKITEYGLGEIVKYHGYLPDDEIVEYFDRCNVGVSYVPITPYYTDVIVTKTVEYLLSGLAVLATDTNENRKMIFENNGVLIPDTPEGFAQGLKIIMERLHTYNSEEIVETIKEYSLPDNIRDKVVPTLKHIAGKD